jgi:hypothetical protein
LAEQEKRQKQRGLEPGLGAREQLYSKLDKMAENRRKLSGEELRPLTKAELVDLEEYLADRARHHAVAKS